MNTTIGSETAMTENIRVIIGRNVVDTIAVDRKPGMWMWDCKVLAEDMVINRIYAQFFGEWRNYEDMWMYRNANIYYKGERIAKTYLRVSMGEPIPSDVDGESLVLDRWLDDSVLALAEGEDVPDWWF